MSKILLNNLFSSLNSAMAKAGFDCEARHIELEITKNLGTGERQLLIYSGDPIDPCLLERCAKFAQAWCKKHLTSLPTSAIPCVGYASYESAAIMWDTEHRSVPGTYQIPGMLVCNWP